MAPKTRRTKRDESVESVRSSSSSASHSSASSANAKASKKASKSSKKAKVSTSSKRGGRRNKFEQMDEEEERAYTTPAPEHEDATVHAVPPQPMQPLPSDEVVPLAAVVAMEVDRAAEAEHGLLREPGPPAAGIRRVTVEGEGAPPIPTELLQLLAG